jgi:hypothetical protein
MFIRLAILLLVSINSINCLFVAVANEGNKVGAKQMPNSQSLRGLGQLLPEAVDQKKAVSLAEVSDVFTANKPSPSDRQKEYLDVIGKQESMNDLLPAIGMRLLPTDRTTARLKKQVEEAKALVQVAQDSPPDSECANCNKYYRKEFAKGELPHAEHIAEIAEDRLKKSQEWSDLENARTNALPALVQSMNHIGKVEHKLHLKEQAKALRTSVVRAEYAKNVATASGEVAQAITRQRLVDRIRAAEDARIARLALQKANDAHQDELKKIGETPRLAVLLKKIKAAKVIDYGKLPSCENCNYNVDHPPLGYAR